MHPLIASYFPVLVFIVIACVISAAMVAGSTIAA